MFAISKAGRVRKQYVRDVRKAMTKIFGVSDHDISEQNEVWDSWVEQKGYDTHGIRELITDDVRDVFKARAIAILLAPKSDFVPFTWHQSVPNDYGGGSGDFKFAALSPQLQAFVEAILEISTDVIPALNTESDSRKAKLFYNCYLLEVLGFLQEDNPVATRLFERYQVIDPAYATGYSPFCSVLSEEIPEKWKKLADDKMRELIRAEQEDCTQPHKEEGKILRNYVNNIEACSFAETFPYDVGLYASQLDFLLGLPNIGGWEIIRSYHLTKILTKLNDEGHKELRHRLARHVMLTDHGEDGAFRVYNDETYAAAVALLEEFGNEDLELGNRLRKAIAEREERMSERRDAARKLREKLDAVMARMR